MAVGTLEKMTIQPADDHGNFGNTAPITVMFNPKEFTISRPVTWRPAPTQKSPNQQFVYPDPAQLDITFVFDVYEKNDADLLKLIKPIQDLSLPHGDAHEPLACKLFWGNWPVFQGVMTNLRQNFTLFRQSGAPVRVNLGCTFKEHYPTPPAQSGATGQHSSAGTPNPGTPEQHSADVAKTVTVRQGDTLHGIARRQYNDPALWRPIADANRIADPLHLPVGAVLLVPSLKTGTWRR